ncbi:MAG: Mur ligase family protein, partial [Candidatus Azambacteria bacterium]|nr:Mur ligase family protein [Candidatus Azambacteria bacterium]
MIPLKNLLYLLQLEEYDLKRFDDWLKRNPGRVVVEKKNHINWTAKARAIFMLAKIFNIKSAVYILSPIDWLFKKIVVFRARAKMQKMADLMVIGVTGSFGKTTIKDAISHVLIHKYKILKTEGNYNTLLGVAKTIVKNLRPEHKIFVCEMAAYQPGDIKEIAGLVKPKIGIITAIGPMHFERFGSMDNILK